MDAKLTSERRGAADVCDSAEVCDGVADDCPADGFQPDGTPCLDGDVCNGMETCTSGSCDPGAPLDCDDSDFCTAESCDAITGCAHTPIPGCATPVPSGESLSHALMAGALLLFGAAIARLRQRGVI